MLIREFRRKHLEKLIEIEREFFPAEEEILSFDPEQLRRMICRISGFPGRFVFKILKFFGREPFKIFVAEIEEKIVGVVTYSLKKEICYLSRLIVHPDFRGMGIGTLLMKTALCYAGRKAQKAILHVNAANVAAKKLHKKLGFKQFESLVYLSAKVDSLKNQDVMDGMRACAYISARADVGNTYTDTVRTRIEQVFRSLFLLPNTHKIVAVRGKEIVGYVQIRYTTPKVGRVENLHMFSSLTSGAEMALIRAAVDEMNDARKETIIAVISLKKRDLIANIKKLGFEERLTMEGMMLTLKNVH